MDQGDINNLQFGMLQDFNRSAARAKADSTRAAVEIVCYEGVAAMKGTNGDLLRHIDSAELVAVMVDFIVGRL